MATPHLSRKRSFAAVGAGDGPAVCSPQTRRSIGLSSKGSTLYQSPLPEVRNEEDLREKKEKRRSRAINVVPISLPAEDNARDDAKLTNDQLASHYVNCIKLSTENKITAKNAFSLHLIDHMNEMLKQRCEGVLNFQMAGGTIFASAKIYASRVDAVHSEAYKVMSSLGRGSNEEKNAANDGEGGPDDDSEKRMPGRKKKKRSKILENNPSALRLKQLEVAYPTDPLDQYYASVFDVANTSGLLVNHLTLCKDGLTVRYHSDLDSALAANRVQDEEYDEDDEKRKLEYEKSAEEHVTDLAKLCETLKKGCICKAPEDFQWDRDNESWNLGDDSSAPSSQDTDPMCSESQTDDDNDAVMDSAPPDVDDCAFEEPSQIFVPADSQDKPTGMDEQLITAFEPGEYSYFRSGAISTWEGPNHWKMRLQSRAPSTKTPADAANDTEQAGGHSRKRKKKLYIDYKAQNVEVDEDGFERAKKSTMITRRMREKLKLAVIERLLPSAGEYSLPDLAKCNLQSHVRINPLAHLKRADVDVDVDQLGSYNYDNANDKNNYCPNMTDDDCFDPGDDIPANFATDYTTNEGHSFPDMTLSQSQNQAQMDMDAMLKGDHLISHPRKVEKISIAYAKKATRVDVRKLKSAMWNALHSSKNDISIAKSDICTAEQSTTEVDTDKKTFSDLYYAGLPGLMPQTMTENLSIPLAFTCLLHLANEKNLSISADPDMSDLNIALSAGPEES